MSTNDELARLTTLVTKFEKLDRSILNTLDKGSIDDFWDLIGQTVITKDSSGFRMD